MSNKVYTVRYYIDWETHGLDSIFKYKEDAEEYAKLMTEKDADVDCHYSVREEIVYSSDDEREITENNACHWILSDDFDGTIWSSDCGLYWQFSNPDTPADNEMVYCPKCGRKLEVVE